MQANSSVADAGQSSVPRQYTSLTTASARRLIVSTIMGTTVEFFDVYIYGTAAGLYFGHIFFANASPTMGAIASFATLASGFLIRPLGGIVGGHFGDRYGRKRVLVASMIIMGISTVLVGVLPGYSAIGVWAPILLVLARLAQGLGAGAEWGGGVLMLVEHMDQRRRGFWGSFANFGIWFGIAIGTLIFTGITRLPQETQLWLWRIPFIASAALVFVGLWIRLGVSETPFFLKAERETTVAVRQRLPLAKLFGAHLRVTVCAVLIATGASSFQMYSTFATSYAKLLNLPISTILLFQFINGLVAMGLTLLFGWLSDRTGRRPMAILGSVLVVPAMYLLYWSMNQANLPLIMLSLVLLEIGHSMVYGPMGAFLAELFDTGTRYTGISVAYQIGAGAIAGLGPLVGAAILAASGGPPHVYLVPLIVVFTGGLTVIGAWLAPERAGRDLLA